MANGRLPAPMPPSWRGVVAMKPAAHRPLTKGNARESDCSVMKCQAAWRYTINRVLLAVFSLH